MTELLCRLFIRDRDNVNSPKTRRAYGTMASLVGIVLNILLFAAKFTAGLIFGSLAISADAFNNLSDAGSSIISLISFKISAKPADRDHPFGHARIEYVASMIVSFLILLIGYELASDSISKIVTASSSTEFSIISVVVLSFSILAKLWMCLFNRRIGKKISSQVMMASSADSLSDVIATSAVLLSTVIFGATGFDIDAWAGIAVSLMIAFAGLKILNETKNSILGEAPGDELVEQIKWVVSQYPEALGVHDLMVHNYGPGRTIATLHIEVDGSADMFKSHDIVDNIEKRMSNELGIQCTIHMDPIVTDDERVSELRRTVEIAVKQIDSRLGIHDFRFVSGETHSNLLFDVTVPFEMKQSDADIRRLVSEAVANIDNTYFAVVTIDRQ